MASSSNSYTRRNNGKKRSKRAVVKEQPKKDNGTKRVNFDNARGTKVVEDIEEGKIRFPMKTGRSNDISWYSRNPSLLASSASLNFYNITGAELPMISKQFPTYPMNAIPGVMSLGWYPYLGGVDNSAINQAADSTYSFVVHANSRNTTYTAPDQMLMIMAGASIFSMIALGIRAYGIMRFYDGTNSYLPDALLKASGFKPDDLRASYSHMWYDLNNLIAQSKQIWVPNTMPVIERWFWLNSHIYMDGSSSKSQYYMFVPTHYLTLTEVEATGTTLQYTEWYTSDAGNSKVWSAYINIVQTMINALVDSEDRGIIFGDILKAYGAEKLYAMREIDANYTVTPQYDQEVLSQIENLNTFYEFPTSVSQDPNTNKIVTNWPTYSTASVPLTYLSGKGTFLNFHQASNPTPEQIMIATRLSLCGVKAYNSGENVNYLPYSAGTEIIHHISMFRHAYTTSGERVLHTMQVNTMNGGVWSNSKNTVTSTYQNANLMVMNSISMFDWHPFLYCSPQLVSPENPVLGSEYNGVIGDIDNFTVLDKETLRRMHNAAIYSEFGVPYLQ